MSRVFVCLRLEVRKSPCLLYWLVGGRGVCLLQTVRCPPGLAVQAVGELQSIGGGDGPTPITGLADLAASTQWFST